MIDNQYRNLGDSALQAGGRRFESAIAHNGVSELETNALAVFHSLIFVTYRNEKGSLNVGISGYIWVHLGTFRCKYIANPWLIVR